MSYLLNQLSPQALPISWTRIYTLSSSHAISWKASSFTPACPPVPFAHWISQNPGQPFHSAQLTQRYTLSPQSNSKSTCNVTAGGMGANYLKCLSALCQPLTVAAEALQSACEQDDEYQPGSKISSGLVCVGNKLRAGLKQRAVKRIKDKTVGLLKSGMGTKTISKKLREFLGTNISANLTWTHNTIALEKKAQQRLHFLCVLRKNNLDQKLLLAFYRSSVESMLSSCLVFGT
ncbi:phytanoyl-CoA hydroxylase [Sarotherodon galilaeus]